jgi:hypothetical protein
MPKYRVTMCRVGYGFKTFEVEALDRRQAEAKGYDQAPNHEYPEKSAEYELQSVERVKEVADVRDRNADPRIPH